MDKICEELYKIGIVPVIAIDDAKDAEPLAEALIKGGLPAAEVTFRTAAAEEAIRIISQKFLQRNPKALADNRQFIRSGIEPLSLPVTDGTLCNARQPGELFLGQPSLLKDFKNSVTYPDFFS